MFLCNFNAIFMLKVWICMFFRVFLYNNQDKEACKKRSKKKKSRKPK